jgi:ankyrin repeat protein
MHRTRILARTLVALFVLSSLALCFADAERVADDERVTVDFEVFENGTPEAVAEAIERLPKETGLETRDGSSRTPLMFAAMHNPSAEVLSVLLKAGAELEARVENGGWTPLMFAAMANESEQVLLALLQAGADAKARDQEGKRALDFAKENTALYKTPAYWKLNDATFN